MIEATSRDVGATPKTFVEYFAGVGLIHEALSGQGWECLLANDNDPRKVKTYQANYPDVPVVDLDIRDLKLGDIPTATLATASFPCIDLSQAGGRVGIDGPKSSIVWSFLDHIRGLVTQGRAPRFLLLENVAGLLTLHGGRSIDLLLTQIADLGYAIDLVQVDARHFVPQARNRAFIIGTRDLPPSDAPMPLTHIRRYKVQEIYSRNAHLPWHFFNFPDPPSSPSFTLRDAIEDLPTDDPRWWNEERMEYFWSHLEHDHRPKLESLLATGQSHIMTAVRRGRRRGIREQIFNLRLDGLASCLRTPKGGSSIQFVVAVKPGWVGVRRILALESARLQGVSMEGMAPDFVLPESEHDGLYAFGDAVCVPAVRWVVSHTIERVLRGEATEPHGQLALGLTA